MKTRIAALILTCLFALTAGAFPKDAAALPSGFDAQKRSAPTAGEAPAADGSVDFSGDAAILTAVRKALSSKDASFTKEALSGVRELAVNGGRIREMSLLSFCTGLESLSLSGSSGFTELSALGELSALKTLDLSNTRTADLTALSQLPALQELNLNHTKVTDLTPLSALENLESLDIGGGNASDLSPLAGLKKLERLSIAKPNYRHADLSALSELKSLKALDLSGNRVVDLTPLSGLTKLESLTLTGNKKLADIEVLSSCIDLKELTVYDTIVAAEDREALVKDLPKLTVYWAKGANAFPTRNPKGLLLLGVGTDDMGTVLESEELVLENVTNVELKPLVAAIKICMPKLKHLTLKNCGIKIVAPLGELDQLETLDLSGNDMTGLKPLSNIENLVKLTVTDCEKLPASAVAWLTQKRPDVAVDWDK